MDHSVRNNLIGNGRIIQAAQQLMFVYYKLKGQEIVSQPLFDEMGEADRELRRLLDNRIQIRNEWGDTVQLAMLILALTDEHGIVPKD